MSRQRRRYKTYPQMIAKRKIISICLPIIILALVCRNLNLTPSIIVKNLSSNTPLTVANAKHKQTKNGPVQQIYYRSAPCGLGHRLMRQAATFHMAYRLYGIFNYMDADWKNCPDENGNYPAFKIGQYRSNIWDTLVGSEGLDIPYHDYTDEAADQMGIDFRRSECPVKDRSIWESKNISMIVNNDMPGYTPMYSFMRIGAREHNRKYYLSKKKTDELFYEQLRNRFIQNHKNKVTLFLSESGFASHIVIGLHIRIGSKIDKGFQNGNRGINDPSYYATNLATTIVEYCKQEKLTNMGLPIMLFVASDRPSTIKDLHKKLQVADIPITVRSYEQEEVFWGNNFQNREGGNSTCLQSWENTMMDMVLLSLADIVIAGLHSSYVQSMPLSMAFSDVNYFPKKPKIMSPSIVHHDGTLLPRFSPYCEASSDGDFMLCYKTYESLFKFKNHTGMNETLFMYGKRHAIPHSVKRIPHKKEIWVPDNCEFCYWGDLKDLCLFKDSK